MIKLNSFADDCWDLVCNNDKINKEEKDKCYNDKKDLIIDCCKKKGVIDCCSYINTGNNSFKEICAYKSVTVNNNLPVMTSTSGPTIELTEVPTIKSTSGPTIEPTEVPTIKSTEVPAYLKNPWLSILDLKKDIHKKMTNKLLYDCVCNEVIGNNTISDIFNNILLQCKNCSEINFYNIFNKLLLSVIISCGVKHYNNYINNYWTLEFYSIIKYIIETRIYLQYYDKSIDEKNSIKNRSFDCIINTVVKENPNPLTLDFNKFINIMDVEFVSNCINSPQNDPGFFQGILPYNGFFPSEWTPEFEYQIFNFYKVVYPYNSDELILNGINKLKIKYEDPSKIPIESLSAIEFFNIEKSKSCNVSLTDMLIIFISLCILCKFISTMRNYKINMSI